MEFNYKINSNNMTKEKELLKVVDKKVSLKIEKEFDPKDYFKTGKGLYIWSDFQERILSKVESVKAGTSLSVSSFDLKEDAVDEKIEDSLPEKHVFTESEVCAVIAELIRMQPKGEKGLLLNNGYANLFYTPAFVVGVRWSGFGGEWGVRAWFRGDDGWHAHDRIFSPATDH
jgi:hypothetical protein